MQFHTDQTLLDLGDQMGTVMSNVAWSWFSFPKLYIEFSSQQHNTAQPAITLYLA
jgi:hypothetical protein